MSMTWGEIERLFLKGAGNSQDAHDEKWNHINDAHRKICGHLELPELHMPDARVTTVHQQDYIDVDDEVYHIDWIVDSSTGRKLDPEPGGMRGRARFIESGETRPPYGGLQFWVRKGRRIWLRDTPENDDQGNPPELVLSFRFHPPNVDDSNRAEHPIPPNQYDMVLVKWSLANFFVLHPPTGENGLPDYGRGKSLMEQVQLDLEAPRNAVSEENLDRRQWTRQMGYSFNILGR